MPGWQRYGSSQELEGRDTRHQTTVCETVLPPISGPFRTRDGNHRLSLNRVANEGHLTQLQKTVDAAFFGHAVIPTFFDTSEFAWSAPLVSRYEASGPEFTIEGSIDDPKIHLK